MSYFDQGKSAKEVLAYVLSILFLAIITTLLGAKLQSDKTNKQLEVCSRLENMQMKYTSSLCYECVGKKTLGVDYPKETCKEFVED